MLSSSRSFVVALFALLSLVPASVDARNPVLQQRGYANLHKRVVRKRAPLPQESGDPVVGAAPLPVASQPARATSSTVPVTTLASTSASTSTTSTSTRIGRTASSSLPGTTSSSSTSSSSSRSTSSTSAPAVETSTSTQISSTSESAVGVSTIIGPNRTLTASVGPSETLVPQQQANTSSSQVKSTTMTVIIAIAASVGGVFILWTIFRKWKLSRSKEFDRRLNPIDWQPTTDEDEEHVPGQNRPRTSPTPSPENGHHTPALSRAPSSLGHSNPFDDFDSPVQSSAPVGGYADLARGIEPTPMQERFQHGPSYHQGAAPVPLHHQGGYGGAY